MCVCVCVCVCVALSLRGLKIGVFGLSNSWNLIKQQEGSK